jgi:hypothetical protein
MIFCEYEQSHRDGKDDSGGRFVGVREIPPLASPGTVIKVAFPAKVKGKK